MRKNLFLYLFIFSLLINVFTYMYFTNKQKFEEGRIESLESRVKSYKDSLTVEKEKVYDANYFSLEYNNNAQQYFSSYNVEDIAIKVRDGIYALNKQGVGNSLVPYPPMNGKPFFINSIKILNNRWVIADFSNGTMAGELIIKYFVDGEGNVSFENAETILYANTMN